MLKIQPFCCREGVFTAPLHSNGSYSFVACVFVAAGMCLPSRCLAMNVYPDFAVPAFGRHITVNKNLTAVLFVTSVLSSWGVPQVVQSLSRKCLMLFLFSRTVGIRDGSNRSLTDYSKRWKCSFFLFPHFWHLCKFHIDALKFIFGIRVNVKLRSPVYVVWGIFERNVQAQHRFNPFSIFSVSTRSFNFL
jgi:hypothetical protein